MAEGSAVVGRVSIKVMPDTSRFREDLRADLEREERRAPEVQIELNVDQDRLATKVTTAVERVERSLPTLVLDIETDEAGLRRNLDRVNAELKRLTNPKVEVNLDEESLEAVRQKLNADLRNRKLELTVDDNIAGLREARAKVDKMLAANNSFKFSVDTDDESLRRFRDHLDDLIDDYDGKNIGLNVDVGAATYRYAATQLALVSRDRIVHLEPLIDSKAMATAQAALAALSGGRLLTSTLDNVWSMLKNLDKNVPLIGSIALAIAGIANSAISATSNLFGIARSLAQIAGAGLALPGLFGGIAVGLGVTIAALKDFNKYVPEFRTSLSTLQDVISANFWTQAEAPMRRMVDSLFPEFAAGAAQTASALGFSFGRMADSLKSHLGGELDAMFGNLSASILIASKGTEDWASIIAILGRNGSQYLPRFAQWFNDIASSLAGWLDEAEKTGKLNDIIETGIGQLVAFGKVLGNAGSILAGFGRAADKAGGSSLTTLANALGRVADVVNGEPFQSRLVSVFTSAHTAMQLIATKAGPSLVTMFTTLATTVSSMLNIVGPALAELTQQVAIALYRPQFNNGLLDMFEGITKAVTALAPAIAPVGAALGSLGSLIGSLAESFGPLLAELLTLLSDAAQRIAPRIAEMSEAMSGTLLSALQTVGPLIVSLVDGLLALVAPILENEVAFGVLVTAIVALQGALAAARIAETMTSIVSGLKAAAEKAPQTATALGKIGKVASGIAIAATAMSLLGDAIEATTTKQGPSVDQFSEQISLMGEDLSRLSAAGKVSIPLLADLNSAFTYAVPDGWANSLGVASLQVDDLNQAINVLHQGTTGISGAMYGLMDTLGAVVNPAVGAQEAINNFDAALAAAVESGNTEAAAAAAAQFTQAYTDQGYTLAEANAQLAQYGTALETWQAKQTVANEAAAVATTAQANLAAAIASVGGVTPSMISTINDASKAFIDFDGAMGDAYSGLDAYMGKLDEQIAAQATWADNMARLAQRGVSEGVLSELSKMGPEGGQLVADLTTASDEQLAKMEEAFKLKSEGAVNNLDSEFGQLSTKVTDAVNPAVQAAETALADLETKMQAAGQDGADGLVAGLSTAVSRARAQGTAAGNAYEAGFRAATDTHSPSRRMREAGNDTVDGLILGLQDRADGVQAAARDIADVARRELEQDISMGLSTSARSARGSVAEGAASSGQTVNKSFTYIAAPGSSINSEEDLFDATSRGRFVF